MENTTKKRIERIAAAFAMSAMCCCAVENGVGVKMPFLWSSEAVDAQTTEIAVAEGNFSVRTFMPSENAVSRADLGAGGPIVTNKRYRIMGKAKTQWYGIDYSPCRWQSLISTRRASAA